jgi:predicted nuclease of restriction endonuclease-like (RecB) superfamily
MAEADAEGWSTRALERQINSFYYAEEELVAELRRLDERIVEL